MMLPSPLGCPLSLKTPNMGNPGSMTGGIPVAPLPKRLRTLHERLRVEKKVGEAADLTDHDLDVIDEHPERSALQAEIENIRKWKGDDYGRRRR